MYASVALNIPIDKTFEYSVPEKLENEITVGSLVRVPLANRKVNGCVIEISPRKRFPYRVKPVEEIISPDFRVDPELIDIARWLSKFYICPIGEALHSVSFIGFNDVSMREERVVRFALSDTAMESLSLTPKQQMVVDYLLDRGNQPTPPLVIEQDLSITRAVIKRLIEKGVLSESTQAVVREDEYRIFTKEEIPLELTSEQDKACKTILQTIEENKGEVFLLFGVTGSGKTEVYLRVIESALKQGKGAIVLVPEISLTPQTVDRFRNRFGSQVGVYHSRMTLGQKFDLWQRIKSEEVKIVVGARSAIFSPLPRLGVIVIDEEQETTYKQETAPRYHTREVAEYRAKQQRAAVILGSATPSIESYYRAQQGEYMLLRLPERINKLPLPAVELLDLGKEMRSKRRPLVISDRLVDEITHTLERNEQVILLLNRRGYANFVLCHSCRKPVRCKKCDVTLTYHKTENKLICHYCNAREDVPTVCPYCGSEHIGIMGMGTQRIEEELNKIFKERTVLRLDLDSTTSRFELLKKWEQIVNGSAEIILGTQMVAKGFDLHRVTLVGVISADMSLFLPDFRAGERTFSLLTQAAGRAGRSALGGKVIIQTFMPDYYAINLAIKHDYEAFARKELAIRKAMRFPPFFHLASIVATSKDREAVIEQSERLGNILKTLTYKPAFQSIDVIGPTEAVIGKIRGKYRWRLLLRSTETEDLILLVNKGLKEYRRSKRHKKVDFTIEIEPLNLL